MFGFLNRVSFVVLALVLCCRFHACATCLTANDVPKSANDPRQMAPWVASIFKRDPVQDKWIYQCGATITEAHVVITAASCVTTINTSLYNFDAIHDQYSNLRIVAGLLTSDYNVRDQHTQEAEVGMIREHQAPAAVTNSGYVQTYTRSANLAGIRLKTRFKLTNFVNKVCVVEVPNTVEELLTLSPGQNGYVAGFDVKPKHTGVKFSGRGLQSYFTSPLKSFHYKLLSPVACVRKYPSSYLNVACGKIMNTERGQQPPCFLDGAGLISLTDGTETGVGTFYLMGVYTGNTKTISKDGPNYPYPISQRNVSTSCDSNDVAYFTKHGEYYRWALSHVYCDEDLLQCQSDNCRPLSELCDGVAQCADKTDESPQVCLNQAVCVEGQFRCKYGVCIDELKVCDGVNDCADGSDEEDEGKCREADIKRNVTCPAIPEEKGVESRCFLPKYSGGASVSCTGSPLPVDSKVEQTCKRYFILEQGSDTVMRTCKRTGKWSDGNSHVICKPSCGISEPKKIGFVVGGQSVRAIGQWPWHVAIYRSNRGQFLLICGGTLVSTRVILTAAHCLTNDGTPLSPETHRVVLGNLVSNFTQAVANRTDSEDAESHSQEIPIEAFVINEYYNPRSYETDIALIILKHPIHISESVRPICITSDENIIQEQFAFANPVNGTKYATTVGFGVDESKFVSHSLKHLELPIIPKRQCEESLASATHEHISFTWLCAGYTNGSSVCNGDSGGGLVLPFDSYGIGRKYYVQGIVSHGLKKGSGDPTCDEGTYKIFTQVSRFVPWIQSYVDKYN